MNTGKTLFAQIMDFLPWRRERKTTWQREHRLSIINFFGVNCSNLPKE